MESLDNSQFYLYLCLSVLINNIFINSRFDSKLRINVLIKKEHSFKNEIKNSKTVNVWKPVISKYAIISSKHLENIKILLSITIYLWIFFCIF